MDAGVVGIYCSDGRMDAAMEIAKRLGIDILSEMPADELCLELGEDGLSLKKKELSFRGDFSEMLKRLNQGRLYGELLVKAAKIKNQEGIPVAIDATAGMGEDAILLAAAGFRVIAFEKNQVIAELLRDAMNRAMDIPELSEIVGRMELRCEDSIAAMPGMSADVIYLDPMFPARNKSALIKKKFQLLQCLESPAMDGEEMLEAAIKAAPRKIIIKRPLKGPYLADRKPSYTHEGKAIRYDCFVFAAKK